MNSFLKRMSKSYSLIILVLFLFPLTLHSQIKFPETPAGKRASEIFDLFNKKSSLTPKEYIRQNCNESFKKGIPESSWGSAIETIRNLTGEVEVASIEKSTTDEIVYIIRSVSKGMQFNIGINVEKSAPYKISMLRFLPVNKSNNNSQKQSVQNTLDEKQSLSNIKEYLDEQAKNGNFSGSVLIAKDGKALLIKSAGYASKRFKALNKPDTKFNLGSLNKSFTAVALLQLVEEGKIQIDDPIGKYLDYFPKDVADKVTIRELLNMSSGWGDYWQNEYYLQHKDEFRTVSQYMKFIKNIPLDFEPGSRMQHSNIGYEVAGAVIEKVSGMDYFDYIREKIYKPAGMTNSDSYDRDGPVENLATGYTNSNPVDTVNTGRQWENTYMLSPKGTPAGGGYSTVEDMLNYDIALRSGKLIDKKYFDFICNRFQGKIGDPFIPQRVLRLAGGAPGVSTFFAQDLKDGYSIIVLTNYDHPVGINIGNEIIKMLGLE